MFLNQIRSVLLSFISQRQDLSSRLQKAAGVYWTCDVLLVHSVLSRSWVSVRCQTLNSRCFVWPNSELETRVRMAVCYSAKHH